MDKIKHLLQDLEHLERTNPLFYSKDTLHFRAYFDYNPFLVYCRELAPGTVSLTGDRAQGDDNKHDSHYT